MCMDTHFGGRNSKKLLGNDPPSVRGEQWLKGQWEVLAAPVTLYIFKNKREMWSKYEE